MFDLSKPINPDDLPSLINELSSNEFDSFVAQGKFERFSKPLEILISALQFTKGKGRKKAFIQAIAIHIDRFGSVQEGLMSALQVPMLLTAILKEKTLKAERLPLLKELDNEGLSILHHATKYPASLKAILKRLIKPEKRAAIQTRDNQNRTVLHHAAVNSELTAELFNLFLQEDQLLNALTIQDIYGRTALHQIASNINLLDKVIAICPQSELSRVFGTQDKYGRMVWQEATTEGLKKILTAYPESMQVKALQELGICSDKPDQASVPQDEEEEDLPELSHLEDVLVALCDLSPSSYSNFLALSNIHRISGALAGLVNFIDILNPEQKNALMQAIATNFPNFKEPLTSLQSLPELVELVLEAHPGLKQTRAITPQDISFAEVNSSHDFSREDLESASEELTFIEAIHSIGEELSSNLGLQTSYAIKPATLDALVLHLSELPPTAYDNFFAKSDFSLLDHPLKQLAAAIQNGFLVKDPKLLQAIAANFQRFGPVQAGIVNLLRFPWLLKLVLNRLSTPECLKAVMDWGRDGKTALHRAIKYPESLDIIFGLLPESTYLELANCCDEHGTSVFLNAATNSQALALLSKRLHQEDYLKLIEMQHTNGTTSLHLAASYPASLRMILGCYPNLEKQLAIIKKQDALGRNGLHHAAGNVESLQLLLNLIPPSERLDWIKIQDKRGGTVLHHTAINLKPVITLLSSLEASERLEAIKVQDQNWTMLHHAVMEPEVFKIILELLPDRAARLEAVNIQDKQGKTVLHHAIEYPESLDAILALYESDEERLAAINVRDKEGKTVLWHAAKRPHVLERLLTLYPESRRLEAINARDSELGKTILHFVISHYPESVKIILQLLPEADRLPALKVRDKRNVALLTQASNESHQIILELLAESDKLQLMRDHENNSSGTLLALIQDDTLYAQVFSNPKQDDTLASYVTAFRVISPILNSHRHAQGFYNESAKIAAFLKTELFKCNTGDEVKRTIINFLQATHKQPDQIHKELLNRLLSVSTTGLTYVDKLKNLASQWNVALAQDLLVDSSMVTNS